MINIVCTFYISVRDFDLFIDPTYAPLNDKNSIPHKMLRRLGIDALYEKSLKYLRKIHDIALDPSVDLYLNDKLHKSVEYLKSVRDLSDVNGSGKQSNRYM